MTKDLKVRVVDTAAEYFYAESLRQMNVFRFSAGLPVISTTQARKLHRDFMQHFEQAIAPGSQAYEKMYGASAPTDPDARARRVSGQLLGSMYFAFNESVKEMNGGQPYYSLDGSSRAADVKNRLEAGGFSLGYTESLARAQGILQHFQEETKWKLGYARDYDTGARELVDEGTRIPMSPYDERFSMRKIFLDNGGRILWGEAGKILNGADEVNPNAEVKLFAEGEDDYSMPNGNFRARGDFVHEDDVSGLSRLRPYMTDAEYKSVQPGIAHSGIQFTSTALDKSVAILQWLTDNGYTYTISPDTNDGQLKARIGNSKLDIRITDKPANENFIGRCYEEGYETYYLTSSQSEFTPDTEDIIRMISYTMGNRVARDEYNNGEISNETGPGYRRPNRQKGVRRDGDEVSAYAGEPAKLFWKMVANGEKGKPPHVVTRHQDGLFPFDSEQGTYPSSQVLMDVRLGQDMNSYRKRGYAVVAIRSRHHASHEFFDEAEQAEAFLTDAISSARTNYEDKLNIEGLIQEAAMHAGEADFMPTLSADPEIAPVQLQYWEVLTGKRELYKAGLSTEEVYQDILGDEESDASVDRLMTALFGDEANGTYEGSPAEQVRQHVADSMDLEFGNLTVGEDGLRFNPWNVAKFMTSSYGQFRNNDNVVEALKALDIDADELRGSEFQVNQIKDKLVKFQPDSARVMGGPDDSVFMQNLARTVRETIETSHCTVNPEDIQIDENGIVHYTAQRVILLDNGNDVSLEPVEGYLGQIFEPDADGVVETRFNGSTNQLFSPGYLAYVLPQEEGESKTLPERVRLKGYQQVLQENIRRQIRSDLLDPHGNVGTTTSVNNSYRGLYENRYKLHGLVHEGESLKEAYIRECRMTGLPDDAIQARFASFKGMIRLPSSFKEDSSLNAAFARSQDAQVAVEDKMNDNARDAWQLSGGENISILSEDWDGYTDKTATGSAKNQGVVRYLVEGATVDENGMMHPALNEDGSINKEARTPLMSLSYMKYVDNTPFDRQQMVFSNLSGASAIDNHTGVATMTMGGYTFDDGAVISKAWAEKNGPMGEDGERRPLQVGDKILDCAGNKSIIGKVINPDLSAEEFMALSPLEKEMTAFFAANRQVSVAMSPYSPMSRFNATSAKFAMDDNFEISLPDGSSTYGGYMPMIVTDKTVDEKTKEYGEDEVKAGGGRSASGQFNWILSGLKSYGLMDECYGNNESSLASYREYLITMGMDMSETGDLRIGYQEHEGEQRHIFMLPEQEQLAVLTRKSAADMFRGAVDNRGGFLEVPVQLELPSGAKLEPIPAEESVYGRAGVQTYKLPIMSSYLRSGQEFQDGTSMTHDYTNHYAQIYASSVAYLNAASMQFMPDATAVDKAGRPMTEAAQRKQFEDARQKSMDRCANRMTAEYREITSDVERRIFTGKHNYVRDHIMAARLPHSATAVWTAEPNCDVDEIRMPSSMAKTLGKKEGEWVLAWRDPCLHRSNLMGMRVAIDDSLVGVAVNPLIAMRPDGDFDGDSVGLYGVQSKAGLSDLIANHSLHNTLLDVVHKDPETNNYALFINTKMDVRSLYARDDERRAQAEADGHPIEGLSLKERFADLENRANDIYQGRGEWANASFEQKDAANRALCQEVSQWTHDVFESYPIGAQCLSMESPQAYLKDLQRMADTKAKGKAANIKDVAKYFGMTYDTKADGSIDYDSVKVADTTLATRQDSKDTQYAVAVKANGTPLGGQVSLNFAELARNLCLIDGLDLTYNATQAVLQAKHDPVMAKQQYSMLQGALKSMWRGRKLEAHSEPVFSDELDAEGRQVPVLTADGKQKYRRVWTEVRDEKNQPVSLTTTEWVAQFMEIHEHPDGMNLAGDINREQVEKVAQGLTGPDGYVYNIESKEVRHALASPMDRLAYQPNLAATIEAAQNQENLFTGEANFHLAPKVIRDNLMTAAQNKQNLEAGIDEQKPLRSFGKSDTLEQTDKGPSRYETSQHYVGENRKGIGHVVTGGYRDAEEAAAHAVSVADIIEETEAEQRPAQVVEESHDIVSESSDNGYATQKDLSDVYSTLDATADETLISDAALAYQDRDDIDDIDDMSGTVPVESSDVDDTMRQHLAAKVAADRRRGQQEDSFVPSVGANRTDMEQIAEKAAAKQQAAYTEPDPK